MATQPHHMEFAEFAARLHEVFEEVREHDLPVLVERDGEMYRLERDRTSNLWKDYDPEQARLGLRRAVGTLAGIDVQQLLADLREQRGQDSHGRPA
ncbi:MAG: hypothetical protein ACRDFX_04950 [Chloroflexota bacterium]